MTVAIVYWSQGGNTKAMAEAIAQGLKTAGAETTLYEVNEASVADVAAFDKIALGCPSMGDEVLEEMEFEPFYQELRPFLSGKKVALFGSYGWGDGAWMRNWEEDVKTAGANLFRKEGLIINETPDDEGISQCKSFGEEFFAV